MSCTSSRGLRLATLVLFVAASRARAAEDCTDLGRIPDCPPVNSGCPAWACPPQDCSTCTPAYDDDGDCALDEELLNGVDDDNDGLADEDISCLDGCDPLSFRCATGLISGSLIDLPSPVEPPVVMDLLARRQPCSGASSTAALTVVLEGYPANYAGCAKWLAHLRVLDAAGAVTLLDGQAIIVLSRRYETFERTLVSPAAAGNVRVTRYTIRADLSPAVAFSALPPELQIPCIDTAFRHVFFYGTLDIAIDTFDPRIRRSALVLHHAPSSLSHPVAAADTVCDLDTVATRSLTPIGPGTHDESFFLVGPAAGFTFSNSGTALLGDYRYGRIRTVGGSSQECSMETRICVSQWELPEPPLHPTECGGQELLRRARLCAGLDDSACTHLALSSDAHCSTIADDLVAFFPIGRWSGTEFPAPMEVSAFEGGLSCVPPSPLTPWRPYWYGTYARLPNQGTWLGPPEALDVIDNIRLTDTGEDKWLVGACNWVDENKPEEQFAPLQFGTMRFFPEQNPEIPVREPCAAKPVITLPAPADCTALTSLTLPCDGEPLVLSAECATVEHCCQCGLPEVQWSRHVGAGWEVVAAWGDVRSYVEDPPPSGTMDYKLEVRCTTSRRVCIAESVLTVTHPPVYAAPTAVPSITCPGQRVRLDAGACAWCTCTWDADVGADPDAACITDVAPLATTTYTVVVRDTLTGCVSDPAGVRVDVTALAARAAPDIVSCGCRPTMLTGSASGCSGPIEYRWRRLAPVAEWLCGDDTTWIPASAGLPCAASECGGTFELSVRCSAPPQCVATDRLEMVIEERPRLGAVLAVDPAPCDVGIDVSWDAAVFPSGSGTYALYRSEVDCADAPAQSPIAQGLRALTYADTTTLGGHSYLYAVQAEDGVPTSACPPPGPQVGGSIALACSAAVEDVGPAPEPVKPCWTLRARHVGDLVTMDWSLARPLEPGEHFHLLKAAPDPRGPFSMLDAEGDRTLTWTETDVATRIQFFDLRIANRCELVTADDEPPGYDLGVTCP